MSTYLIAADPKGSTPDYWPNKSKNNTQQFAEVYHTIPLSVFSQSEVWNLYETLGYFLIFILFFKATSSPCSTD